MTQKVNIGGKDVGLAASAATPILYKEAWGQDFLLETKNLAEPTIDTVRRLAFVMYIESKAATYKEARDMLTKDNYLEWLFDLNGAGATAIESAAQEIVDVYMGQMKATSSPKE